MTSNKKDTLYATFVLRLVDSTPSYLFLERSLGKFAELTVLFFSGAVPVNLQRSSAISSNLAELWGGDPLRISSSDSSPPIVLQVLFFISISPALSVISPSRSRWEPSFRIPWLRRHRWCRVVSSSVFGRHPAFILQFFKGWSRDASFPAVVPRIFLKSCPESSWSRAPNLPEVVPHVGRQIYNEFPSLLVFGQCWAPLCFPLNTEI